MLGCGNGLFSSEWVASFNKIFSYSKSNHFEELDFAVNISADPMEKIFSLKMEEVNLAVHYRCMFRVVQ